MAPRTGGHVYTGPVGTMSELNIEHALQTANVPTVNAYVIPFRYRIILGCCACSRK